MDDVADLGLGEAVLSEVVSGGVDPAFSSLGPRPPHRVGRCCLLLMAEGVNTLRLSLGTRGRFALGSKPPTGI